MQQRDIVLLVVILVLVAVAAWVDLPSNPGIHVKVGSTEIDHDIKVHQGLDLQGGMRVILEADMPAGQDVDAESMTAVQRIIENRVNGLGVTEPVVQAVGGTRISVELPGIKDPEQAIALFRETGLLEFVDAGYTPLPAGAVIKSGYTEYGVLGALPVISETETITPTATSDERIYPTILTGGHLKSAAIGFDEGGRPEIDLEFTDEGTQLFAEYTANNIGRYLAIAMDDKIISSPQIQSAIPDGKARITSSASAPFSIEDVKTIVIQLKYGALPVPLKVIERRSVGPTLGQDSVDRSVRAGGIGLIVVLIFMIVYYRLLGVLAALALLIYALLTFALFKLIPVTLTLPGIAGFLLSVGTAVDANILIFERIKEELRRGRSLGRAIEAGFDRAWTAIWDSNLASFITCAVLWVFGNTFGASIVKGFAITLFIGVAVSMFTAITVTRTFLRTFFSVAGEEVREKKWLLGV